MQDKGQGNPDPKAHWATPKPAIRIIRLYTQSNLVSIAVALRAATNHTKDHVWLLGDKRMTVEKIRLRSILYYHYYGISSYAIQDGV